MEGYHHKKAARQYALTCEDVSKKFCRDLRKSLWYGFQDILSTINSGQSRQNGRNGLRPGEFWANDNISFSLNRGECLGVIGKNGAGKTTLLKLLNRLIIPNHGTIEINGTVGALIALTSGFNPILTARENVFINGAILGLKRRQIEDKYSEIVDFAELHEVMHAPIATFSSGMTARLGFAIAMAFPCDILLIDEVLAVGDFNFRQKCFKKIAEFTSAGGSCILVSHSTDQILSRTDRVLLLDSGQVLFEGAPREAVLQYEEMTLTSSQVFNQWEQEQKFQQSELADLVLTAAKFTTSNGAPDIYSGYDVSLFLDIYRRNPEQKYMVIFNLYSQDDSRLVRSEYPIPVTPTQKCRLKCSFMLPALRPGYYLSEIRIHDMHNRCVALVDRKKFILKIMETQAPIELTPGYSPKAILDVQTSWKVEQTQIPSSVKGSHHP